MGEEQQVVLYLSNGEHLSFCADYITLLDEIDKNKFITVEHDDGSSDIIYTSHIVYVHIETAEDYYD